MGECAWNLEKESTEARIKICPICGKRFIPAPEHYWKIGTGEYDMETRNRLVCSYSCMRVWEKEQMVKTRKHSARVNKDLLGVDIS